MAMLGRSWRPGASKPIARAQFGSSWHHLHSGCKVVSRWEEGGLSNAAPYIYVCMVPPHFCCASYSFGAVLPSLHMHAKRNADSSLFSSSSKETHELSVGTHAVPCRENSAACYAMRGNRLSPYW